MREREREIGDSCWGEWGREREEEIKKYVCVIIQYYIFYI